MNTDMVRIAELANLSAIHTVALPTVITVAARKVGMTDKAMIAECLVNVKLRNYLADICRSNAHHVW